MSNEDMTLVREFAARRSERAFETLVSRHVNMIYAAALRRTDDAQLAEEITQAVFIILARKAGSLSEKTVVPGWLYRTAKFVAADALKAQHRRQLREQEAFVQSALNNPEPDATWAEIAPMLDAALDSLNDKDRSAVVLRFLQERSLGEVGASLGISPDAAKMRVNRALEKLHRYFYKQGIVSTTAIIGNAISTHSSGVAPAGLMAATTKAVMANGAAASSSITATIHGALKAMAWTKTKTALLTGAVVLFTAGTATFTIHRILVSPLDAYLQDPELNAVYTAPPMVRMQKTHFTIKDLKFRTILSKTDGQKEIGRNLTLSTAILKAYEFPSNLRIVMPADLRKTRVDYLVTVTNQPHEKLKAEIKRKFGCVADLETREADVMQLTLDHVGVPGMTASDNSSWKEWRARYPTRQGIHYHGITVAEFALMIEALVGKPVIDHTELNGKYDFVTDSFHPDQLEKVFLDQLGLKLVTAREPVEMLVVKHVN